MSRITDSLKTPNNAAELALEYKDNELVYYSPMEELINVTTHMMGIIFGLILLIFMLLRATTAASYATAVLSCTGFIIMFSCSAVYHGATNIKAKRIMRRVDYSAINLTVIACGTAPCLLYGMLYGYIAYGISILISLAVVYLCMRYFGKLRFSAIISNFVNGALLSVAYILAYDQIPSIASWFNLSGLILSIIGASIFGIKIKYAHSIFHIFVLVGPALCMVSNFIQIN